MGRKPEPLGVVGPESVGTCTTEHSLEGREALPRTGMVVLGLMGRPPTPRGDSPEEGSPDPACIPRLRLMPWVCSLWAAAVKDQAQVAQEEKMAQ
jgi:hypothetical protein